MRVLTRKDEFGTWTVEYSHEGKWVSPQLGGPPEYCHEGEAPEFFPETIKLNGVELPMEVLDTKFLDQVYEWISDYDLQEYGT